MKIYGMWCLFFFHGATAPKGAEPHYRGFTTTLRHTTLGRTPLDEWSARVRDLYLTTHSIHKRQTSMYPAGFEPAIPASDRPHTHALDRTATGIGECDFISVSILVTSIFSVREIQEDLDRKDVDSSIHVMLISVDDLTCFMSLKIY